MNGDEAALVCIGPPAVVMHMAASVVMVDVAEVVVSWYRDSIHTIPVTAVLWCSRDTFSHYYLKLFKRRISGHLSV